MALLVVYGMQKSFASATSFLKGADYSRVTKARMFLDVGRSACTLLSEAVPSKGPAFTKLVVKSASETLTTLSAFVTLRFGDSWI